MKGNFNKTPLTEFAATIAKVSGIGRPASADERTVGEVIDLVKDKTGKETVDKVVIFNPDAIGQEFFYRYRKKIFIPLEENSDLSVKFLTAFPSKTPVCFATMFTGADPSVHGIQAYVKPQLETDTLFDAWSRAGKKVALVSKSGQSIPRIFAGRNIDYFLTKGDDESIDKAIELIAGGEYDVIEIYNQEYDDMLHVTHPRSIFCKRAARHYVRNYLKLLKAINTHYRGFSTLLTFSPDHGAHRVHKLLFGTHGDKVPSDMNIMHWFKII